jgi:hypothetical protein
MTIRCDGFGCVANVGRLATDAPMIGDLLSGGSGIMVGPSMFIGIEGGTR